MPRWHRFFQTSNILVAPVQPGVFVEHQRGFGSRQSACTRMETHLSRLREGSHRILHQGDVARLQAYHRLRTRLGVLLSLDGYLVPLFTHCSHSPGKSQSQVATSTKSRSRGPQQIFGTEASLVGGYGICQHFHILKSVFRLGVKLCGLSTMPVIGHYISSSF